MVCGKGGSGKSVISVLMARVLSRSGRVYLIDSDESNALLPSMLGVKPPKPLVEYLGGRDNIFKRGEVDIAKALARAGEGIRLSSLPREYTSTSPEGINLIVIGKVRNFGEGCACPLNYLTRVLLKNLLLEEGEVVIVDTDAGIEHVGRRVEEGVDAILAVVDPTAEALTLAKILKESFERLNKRFWLVLNKATPTVAELLKGKAKEMGLNVDGVIRFDEEVFKSCLEGKALRAGESIDDIEDLLESIGLMKGV